MCGSPKEMGRILFQTPWTRCSAYVSQNELFPLSLTHLNSFQRKIVLHDFCFSKSNYFDSLHLCEDDISISSARNAPSPPAKTATDLCISFAGSHHLCMILQRVQVFCSVIYICFLLPSESSKQQFKLFMVIFFSRVYLQQTVEISVKIFIPLMLN